MGGSTGGGGQGVRTPQKIHKNIGFHGNIDPDPLKVAKLSSQHSMVGHYRHASETLFNSVSRWRADDSPLLVAFRSSLHSIN